MTLFFRRPLLPLAVVAASLLCIPPSLWSQAVHSAPSTLPDAPTPHTEKNSQTDQTDQAMLDDDDIFSSSSQQSPQPTPAYVPQQPQLPPPVPATSEEELQRELHQRLGGVVPNFNAVIDGSNLPLTPGQKIRAAFRSAIDPYQFGLAAFTSAVGQAENSHSSYAPIPGTQPLQYMEQGYEQGWSGYGKRFGANFTDQFDGTILGNGVFPILLHQDARYYRMGNGSFKKRFLYSIGTTIYCKGDNGKWQPNVSNLLGNLASGGISNLYYPAADRGFDLTMEQGFLVTAEGAFGALMIEFWPDISNHFRHKLKPLSTTSLDNPQP
ncbi:MAG TPA: hypothetical protein VNW54_06295 [Granulicella sp.]|nr:hypothetical protein [Granulicella sp.]